MQYDDLKLFAVVSALVPLAKKFTSEEPSIETIGGENVISWPSVVKHIDCYNFTVEEFKSITTKYKVSSMMLAPIHGFGFWFEVEFNGPQESSHNIPSNLNPLEIIQNKRRRSSEDTVLLSTAPEDEPTHWQQVWFVTMVYSFIKELIQFSCSL